MYQISINNQIAQTTASKQVAFANFRALCRDYKHKPDSIVLMLSGDVLHKKPENLQLIDDINKTTSNEILKLVLKQLGIEVKQLKTILQDSTLNLSNSRIDGWLRHDDTDRRYTPMYNDELYAVLDILLDKNQSDIKSPKNIIKIRKNLNLT